mmetsp:Transcript_10966/g.45681  ORF Transcript_10966/g.45681 Transcript_10966/m.45681 type:complete len:109 (+) Transcript_10966:60-386(+)
MRHTYAVGRRAANANKLWRNKNERRQYDDFANLYSIIKMIDKLEKAYVNSTVASAAYDASCAELIAKYKTLRTVTEDGVPNVQHFMWVQFIFGTCSASERVCARSFFS